MLPMLIGPETLATHLGDPKLLIVDLSNPANHASGHIPGAVPVSPGETQSGRPPSPGILPSIEQLTHLFRRIGLTADKHVVVCDDEGGGWAGRFIWLLDNIGHTKYSLLDGGLVAWRNEDFPVSVEHTVVSPSLYQVELYPGHTIEYRDMLAAVGNPKIGIWDARSPEEYSGQRVFAQRGGHIPGAVNLEWTQCMDPSRNLRLKSLDRLRQALHHIGLTPDREIITHCQTHHRSGLTYVVAKLLGYPSVRGYGGSWSEWGNHPEAPVER